jgi:uncharacterized protein YktA (UPF0223 family)
MFGKKNSQSVSISSSQVSGVQIGQADRDLTQIQEVKQGVSEAQLTSKDVIELLAEIEALTKSSVLAEAQKAKVLAFIEAAKASAQEKEPNKGYAANSLQQATKVLKEASETVEAGQGLWENVQTIVVKLIPWLGVAKSYFGF